MRLSIPGEMCTLPVNQFKAMEVLATLFPGSLGILLTFWGLLVTFTIS